MEIQRVQIKSILVQLSSLNIWVENKIYTNFSQYKKKKKTVKYHRKSLGLDKELYKSLSNQQTIY